MKSRSPLFALAIAASLLLTSTAVLSQDKPIELRYTSGAPPKGNPWVNQINRLAKEVDEQSKGSVKISPFFASQLGSEQDTVQQVARGRIDMGGFSAGSAALVVPEVALLLMPFYFRNVEEADCVLDTAMVKPLTELFAKKGIHFFGYGDVGSIEMFGTKPYVMPKDLNGIKAAIYANKTQALFFGSLGANVNPLGLPEWIPAFQTGMVEAVMTPITYALPSGLTKVAPIMSKLDLYDSPAINLINMGTWNRLSKDQQAAFERATAKNPSALLRKEVRGFEAVLYGMMEKDGGKIVTVTQEQRDAWRKALEPVYPQIVKETGGDPQAFFAAMEAGRKACAK